MHHTTYPCVSILPNLPLFSPLSITPFPVFNKEPWSSWNAPGIPSHIQKGRPLNFSEMNRLWQQVVRAGQQVAVAVCLRRQEKVQGSGWPGTVRHRKGVCLAQVPEAKVNMRPAFCQDWTQMCSAILLVVPQTHYFDPKCQHGMTVLTNINVVIISLPWTHMETGLLYYVLNIAAKESPSAPLWVLLPFSVLEACISS